MRTPWPALAAGAVVAALGVAGVVRGAIPQSVASASSSLPDIVVSGAYVRAPVPPVDIAAGYFTVTNNSGTADRLTGVETGAGASAEVHTVGRDGSMTAAANGVVIPAHGRLVLRTGQSHLMIEHVYGTLKAGQTVNLELDFAGAGPIDVVAPVIAVGAPVPVGGHS